MFLWPRVTEFQRRCIWWGYFVIPAICWRTTTGVYRSWSDLTVEEAARRVGVSPAALYRHLLAARAASKGDV
jgi:hypothetical protein